MSAGSEPLQGFPSWTLLQLVGCVHGGGGAPCCFVSSKATVHVSLTALCSSWWPYLLQRPEDDGEREGYAWAQEDGLRDNREEELGLGGPAGKNQKTSTSGPGLRN